MEIFRRKTEPAKVLAPLIDSANRPGYKTTPTLAAGDIKILRHTSAGGGTWSVANITSLPVEIGTSGMLVFSLTTQEMQSDETIYPIAILCHDAADGEWDDQAIVIWTRDRDMDDVMDHGDDANALVTAISEFIPAIDENGYVTLVPAYDPAKSAAPELGGNVAAIKAKTDNLPASPAALGSQMDLVDAPNATALASLGEAAGAINVDSTGGNLALTKAIEALVAACVGKAAYDPATGVVTFKGRNGTSTIVQVTCDGSGNRTASGLS